jgi:hypothetical protein
LPNQSRETEAKRDWRISATLGAVWVIALVVIGSSGVDIPASMLAIATVFFVLLIPAMNDLVRSIERVAGKRNPGAKHE